MCFHSYISVCNLNWATNVREILEGFKELKNVIQNMLFHAIIVICNIIITPSDL